MERLLFQEFDKFIQKQGISHGAIMNVGIDNLRELNAAFGIETGDEIIRILSEILITYSGAFNVTRLDGSDEFVLLFGEDVDASEGERIFSLVQNKIADICRDKIYFFTISAGMVFFQNVNEQTEILLTCAEYALNRAKEQGKNNLFIYEKEHFLNYMKKMQLLHDLQSCVRNSFEGFELYYQPIVSVDKNTMVAAEALLRWKHPKYPKISPAEFIPVLEESGLMVDVGYFVIENAMKQAFLWGQKYPNFSLHINLSYAQFHHKDLADHILLLSEQIGVLPKQIVFEITESGFVGKMQNAIQQIDKLRGMGFLMALDDFGTGYSNFIYLKELNFNIVKLDRVFISEALKQKSKRELLSHIVETVHSMGMKVCFEGVETVEDFLNLNELGPEYIQGFFFGLPVPKESFEANFTTVLHQDILEKIPRYQKSDSSMAYLVNEMKEQEQEEKLNKIKLFRSFSFFLPILLVVILIFGIGNNYVSRKILKKQLDESMTNSLEISIDTLETKMNETKKLTDDLAVYVEGSYQTVNLSNYEFMLDEIVASRSQIAGAGIWFERYAFQNTEIVCPYVYWKDGEKILTYYYGGDDYNYFEQEYYTKTKELRKGYVTNPYYDSTMDSQIITFTTPIINDANEFIGVISVDLYVNDVEKIVQDLNPTENGFAFICDKDMNVFCGYDNVPDEMLEKMTGSDGTFEYSLNDIEYEVYYEELKATGWKAAILFDIQSAYRPINRLSIVIITTSCIALGASAAIIIALMLTLERQKRMEYEQKKSLNEIHFKALRSSYYTICVVDLISKQVKVVYESPIVKSTNIASNNYLEFIERCRNCIAKEDQDVFMQFTNLSNLKENLLYREFVSQDVRMKFDGQMLEWVELTASAIGHIHSNEKEDSQILFMIRDIHENKNKLLLAQEEKQILIGELQEKNQELFRMSITDDLTGIYNRKGLSYYVPAILEEASKDNKKLFFLIADVNKLKTINDNLGHLKGDEVIKEAAYVISHTEFKELIAARTGGDEFVLFGAVDASKEDFPQLVEKKIYEVLTGVETDEVPYGISIGYYWGNTEGNDKIEYFYNYADKMMYERKRKL